MSVAINLPLYSQHHACHEWKPCRFPQGNGRHRHLLQCFAPYCYRRCHSICSGCAKQMNIARDDEFLAENDIVFTRDIHGLNQPMLKSGKVTIEVTETMTNWIMLRAPILENQTEFTKMKELDSESIGTIDKEKWWRYWSRWVVIRELTWNADKAMGSGDSSCGSAPLYTPQFFRGPLPKQMLALPEQPYHPKSVT